MCGLCSEVNAILRQRASDGTADGEALVRAINAIKACAAERRAEFWDHQFALYNAIPQDSSEMFNAVNRDTDLAVEIEQGFQRCIKRHRTDSLQRVAEHERRIQSLNAAITESEAREHRAARAAS